VFLVAVAAAVVLLAIAVAVVHAIAGGADGARDSWGALKSCALFAAAVAIVVAVGWAVFVHHFVATVAVALEGTDITVTRRPALVGEPLRFDCAAGEEAAVTISEGTAPAVVLEGYATTVQATDEEGLGGKPPYGRVSVSFGHGLPGDKLEEVRDLIGGFLGDTASAAPTRDEAAAETERQMAEQGAATIEDTPGAFPSSSPGVILESVGDGVCLRTRPLTGFQVVLGTAWLGFAAFWTVGAGIVNQNPFLGAFGVLFFWIGSRQFAETAVDIRAADVVVRRRLLKVIPWSVPWPSRVAFDEITEIGTDAFGACALIARNGACTVAGLTRESARERLAQVLRRQLEKRGWRPQRRFVVSAEDPRDTILLAPTGMQAFAEITGQGGAQGLMLICFAGVLVVPIVGLLPVALLLAPLEKWIDTSPFAWAYCWALAGAAAWLLWQVARSRVSLSVEPQEAPDTADEPAPLQLVVRRRVWRKTVRTHAFPLAPAPVVVAVARIGDQETPVSCLTIQQGARIARLAAGFSAEDLQELYEAVQGLLDLRPGGSTVHRGGESCDTVVSRD